MSNSAEKYVLEVFKTVEEEGLYGLDTDQAQRLAAARDVMNEKARLAAEGHAKIVDGKVVQVKPKTIVQKPQASFIVPEDISVEYWVKAAKKVMQSYRAHGSFQPPSVNPDGTKKITFIFNSKKSLENYAHSTASSEISSILQPVKRFFHTLCSDAEYIQALGNPWNTALSDQQRLVQGNPKDRDPKAFGQAAVRQAYRKRLGL